MAQGTRANWVLWAALVAGASYVFAGHAGVEGVASIAWKGSGVALLALWAAANARNRDGWLVVAVLALGALGDVLLDAAGLSVGALAFLAGHVVAVVLYLLNRARPLGMALPIVVIVPLVAFLLPEDRQAAPGIALYATGLGAMAGTALISRFPSSVAFGAMLFVVSDWLIFARLGPLMASPLPDLLVWPLYFAGQAMIAVGLVGAIRASAAPAPAFQGGAA